ncbi:glycosyl transferase [Paenibacillus sp. SC116]|uniref:macrolide family glycosyltransferase n=1 Tax=Paenibacillus sp. SC116 TaxID=2968986 RepID=UPI00215B0D5D|nr:macrolide family glycosyltransferase [Paenibacillus sp. SC116]MCR8842312.1 glycosyl transferase [Paenibacillus sp. SC116]
MARVLIVNIPAEGHVNPTLGLVKQLIDRGEEVVYVCAEEYRNKVLQTGAEFRSYPFQVDPFSYDPDLKPAPYKHPSQFANMVVRGIIQKIVPEILKVVEQDTYDYLIFDSLMGWGGTIIAQSLGIPAVCSIASFAFVDPLGSEQGFIDDDVENVYESTLELAHQLAQQFNVPAPSIPELTKHTGQLKLVYTSRYLQPKADQLDESFYFAGTSVVPRKDAPNFPLDQLLDPHKQTVYIAMGTILNRDLAFYKLCFDAFQDLPIQFILSSGKDTDMEPLADCIPSNFIVRPYIPQLEVLERADAFVTHAGMNSVSEALYYNVPMVMIPLTSDQPLVSNRVQELGAGITLDHHTLTAEVLREALMQVLGDSSFKQQAFHIGESLRQAGGYIRAADTIISRFSIVKQ